MKRDTTYREIRNHFYELRNNVAKVETSLSGLRMSFDLLFSSFTFVIEVTIGILWVTRLNEKVKASFSYYSLFVCELRQQSIIGIFGNTPDARNYELLQYELPKRLTFLNFKSSFKRYLAEFITLEDNKLPAKTKSIFEIFLQNDH
ncbi:hypothetical protein Bhyg_13027 [Pseudolycoriella hygida]|uniref:Uncharacterized protein n=1 Tax=Pseudolycoriella hygida TaxID=35572 RepID=A0A9Q0S0Y3_9DIPT|nr:hypothetical protein Bhyg_13027 [Pseudolycoriella hygida]